MGDGLKKVAQRCGGIAVKTSCGEVRFSASGKPSMAAKSPTKVFRTICDTLGEMSARPNGLKQAELVMCAKSAAEMARKCEELGVSFRRREISDISSATVANEARRRPGVLLWAPLSEHGSPLRPVIGKEAKK